MQLLPGALLWTCLNPYKSRAPLSRADAPGGWLVASLKLTKLNCSFRGTKHAANACSNLFDGLRNRVRVALGKRGAQHLLLILLLLLLPNNLIYCPFGVDPTDPLW